MMGYSYYQLPYRFRLLGLGTGLGRWAWMPGLSAGCGKTGRRKSKTDDAFASQTIDWQLSDKYCTNIHYSD